MHLLGCAHRGFEVGRCVTRFAKRTDSNHALIRDSLRAEGWEVLDLSKAGQGVADLAVRVAPGVPHFLELKSDEQPLSAQALTPAEEKWHYFCWGFTSKVRSLDEAREALKWAKDKHALPGRVRDISETDPNWRDPDFQF